MLLVPLFQNESWYSTFLMGMGFTCRFIVLQIKLVLKQKEKATRKFVLCHVLKGVSLFEISASPFKL